MSAGHRTTRRRKARSPLGDARIACRAAERWHQTLKNVRWGNDPPDRFLLLLTLLENHYLPGALEAAVGDFVDLYNYRRVHESLGNVAPADAYFGRAPAILEERRRIKEQTIQQRRLLNQQPAA